MPEKKKSWLVWGMGRGEVSLTKEVEVKVGDEGACAVLFDVAEEAQEDWHNEKNVKEKARCQQWT